jgi:hypothetical protein
MSKYNTTIKWDVVCSYKNLKRMNHATKLHTLCDYLYTIFIYFCFIVGELTSFSFIGLSIISSSQINSRKNSPL